MTLNFNNNNNSNNYKQTKPLENTSNMDANLGMVRVMVVVSILCMHFMLGKSRDSRDSSGVRGSGGGDSGAIVVIVSFMLAMMMMS
jgi:hypothetical protein